MDGAWDRSDLVGLVQLLVRNRGLLDAMERGPARLGGLAMRALHALRRNTRDGRAATSPSTTTSAIRSSACSCPKT